MKLIASQCELENLKNTISFYISTRSIHPHKNIATTPIYFPVNVLNEIKYEEIEYKGQYVDETLLLAS